MQAERIIKSRPEYSEAPVSFNEVMEAISMSHVTLRALVKDGKIRRHKVGRVKTYYFLSEVFEDIKKL